MLHSNHDQNNKTIPDTRSLQIAIVLVITILVLAQTLLIYVILSQDTQIPVLARPEACDNFEMKSLEERANCLPVNYTPKNMIET